MPGRSSVLRGGGCIGRTVLSSQDRRRRLVGERDSPPRALGGEGCGGGGAPLPHGAYGWGGGAGVPCAAMHIAHERGSRHAALRALPLVLPPVRTEASSDI